MFLLHLIVLIAFHLNKHAHDFHNRKALIIGLSQCSTQSQADPLIGVPSDLSRILVI